MSSLDSFGRIKFTAPRQTIDVKPQRAFAQTRFGAWRLMHDGHGQVNVLTITSAKRNTLLPDTPTVAESGLDGYEVFEWNGMFVPSGTPVDVVNKLQDAVRDVLQEAEVKENSIPLALKSLHQAQRISRNSFKMNLRNGRTW